MSRFTDWPFTSSASVTDRLWIWMRQSLDWELDTVSSSPTSTDWKFPIQTNVHATQVLSPPTTSCSPAPPSTLWDTRHGPVRWMPTGSFWDWLRHWDRLRTSPYSPDWRSSLAGNAEEEEEEDVNQSPYNGYHLTATCLEMRLLTLWQRRAQQKSKWIDPPATLRWRPSSRPSNTAGGGTSTHGTTRLTPTTC